MPFQENKPKLDNQTKTQLTDQATKILSRDFKLIYDQYIPKIKKVLATIIGDIDLLLDQNPNKGKKKTTQTAINQSKELSELRCQLSVVLDEVERVEQKIANLRNLETIQLLKNYAYELSNLLERQKTPDSLTSDLAKILKGSKKIEISVFIISFLINLVLLNNLIEVEFKSFYPWVITAFKLSFTTVPAYGIYLLTHFGLEIQKRKLRTTENISKLHQALITSGQLPEKLVNLDEAIRKLNEHWERSSQQAPPDTSRLVNDVDSSDHQTQRSSDLKSADTLFG